MHYHVCHPLLMALLQIVHVPKQFALAQAKKRDRTMTIKGSERKQGTLSLSGLMNDGDAPLIVSVHRSQLSPKNTALLSSLWEDSTERAKRTSFKWSLSGEDGYESYPLSDLFRA